MARKKKNKKVSSTKPQSLTMPPTQDEVFITKINDDSKFLQLIDLIKLDFFTFLYGIGKYQRLDLLEIIHKFIPLDQSIQFQDIIVLYNTLKTSPDKDKFFKTLKIFELDDKKVDFNEIEAHRKIIKKNIYKNLSSI